MGLVLATFLKSCPACIVTVVGLYLKSAKNCGLHFNYDGDVDLF